MNPRVTTRAHPVAVALTALALAWITLAASVDAAPAAAAPAATFTGTQLPTIAGTPEVGKPLTIVNGSDWAPTPDVTWYQWYRSDSATPGGSWARSSRGRRTSRTLRQPPTRESIFTSA